MPGAARDLEALVRKLSAWANDHQVADPPVTIERLAAAEGGASSETYLLDAAVGPGRRPVRWVLRVQPTDFQVYQDPSVERQFRMMQALASTEVPTPGAVRYEGDSSILGAPFFLMEAVEGEAPPRDYHSSGVLAQAVPAAREKMWLESLEAMARLHRLNPGPFAFLGLPGGAKDGTAQELERWDRFADWAKNPELPVVRRARNWLDEHRPPAAPLGVAWGDARLSNILFRDGACVALLDWETACLGGAETDLGWWLYYDHVVAEGAGVPRLEGIGGRDATIAAYESFAERKLQAIEWHEVFATWRFVLISERAIRLHIAAGARLDAGEANPAVRRLMQLMAEL